MPRGFGGLAALCMLVLVGFGVGDALAQSTLTDSQRLKLLQRQILLRERAEQRAELRKRRDQWERGKAKGQRLQTAEHARTDLAPYAPRGPGLSPSGSIPFNVMMNDSTGEDPGTTQSEVSIAAFGNQMVAAWNDAIAVFGGTSDYLGYGYSSDGGITWMDGGAPPNIGIGTWASDPVVAVNERTGAFFVCGLVDQFQAGRNGIAIVKGTFSGNTLTWGTPHIVAQVANSLAILDKEWVAVDSLTGNLYVTYTYFAGNSDEIRFQRSLDEGQSWSSPITLSSNTDAGLVQGSRPSVGPSGEVYAVWHAIGFSNNPLGIGPDHLRVRRSLDQGASFSSETTPASLFSNFGSGAPGFNRGVGLTFPGIAVDRSNGPHRGRVLVSWPETVDFFDDRYPQPGVDPAISERENNNSAALATPFSPGAILRGTVALPTDLDYFSWSAVQGGTYVFWLDSLDVNLDAALRVWCTDANPGPGTNIAFSQNGSGGEDLIVFTAPTTATYYVRVASYAQSHLGRYRIRTVHHDGSIPARARDQRDLFVGFADDGHTWSTPVRVNDSPPYFDDWLPEVAVDQSGTVSLASYDWRDSPDVCGGGSNVYLYRSSSGGLSWGAGERISEATTNWTRTYSVLIPNQGDYIGLFGGGSTHVAWADGRSGDIDAYTAAVTPTDVTPPSVRVTLTPSSLWPPNHSLADVHALVEVTDDTDPNPSVQLLAITSDEPDAGTDDEDVPGDVQEAQLGTPDFDFRLRSERLGSGDGRTYTVCYRAQDHAGNSSDACAVVNVPHDQRGLARLERDSQHARLVLFGSESATAASVSVATVQVHTAHFQSFLPSMEDLIMEDRDGDGFADLSLLFDAADSWSVVNGEPLTARWLTGGTWLQADVERTDVTGVEAGGAGAAFAMAIQPNPARAQAVLRYVLPRDGAVRLSIFDVAGHRVAELAQGRQVAGRHQVAFPASKPRSAQLYLYRLEWEGRELTGKFVVFP
jgi:hypothetical protein